METNFDYLLKKEECADFAKQAVEGIIKAGGDYIEILDRDGIQF